MKTEKKTEGKKTAKELTRAELEVMQVIWRRGRAMLGEIVDDFPTDNRPAYTTISTIVRILERKGFVAHETYGKVHCYFPVVSRDDYRGDMIANVVANFFDNSPGELLSYFARQGTLSLEQYEELQKTIIESAGAGKKPGR